MIKSLIFLLAGILTSEAYAQLEVEGAAPGLEVNGLYISWANGTAKDAAIDTEQKFRYTGYGADANFRLPVQMSVSGLLQTSFGIFGQQVLLTNGYVEKSDSDSGSEQVNLTSYGLKTTTHLVGNFQLSAAVGGAVGSIVQTGATPRTQTFNGGLFGSIDLGFAPMPGDSGFTAKVGGMFYGLTSGSEEENPDRLIADVAFNHMYPVFVGYNLMLW